MRSFYFVLLPVLFLIATLASCSKDDSVRNLEIPEKPINPLINTTWSSEYTGADESGSVVLYLFMLGFDESEAALSMTQIVVGAYDYGMLSYYLPYDYTFDSDANEFLMYGKEGGFVTNGEDIIYFEDQGFEIWDTHGYLNEEAGYIVFWLSDDSESIIFYPSENNNKAYDFKSQQKDRHNIEDIELLLKRVESALK